MAPLLSPLPTPYLPSSARRQPLMQSPDPHALSAPPPIVLLTPPDYPHQAVKRKLVTPIYNAAVRQPHRVHSVTVNMWGPERPSTSNEAPRQRQPSSHLHVPSSGPRPVSQPVAGPTNPLLAYRTDAATAQYASLNSPVSPVAATFAHQPYAVSPVDPVPLQPPEQPPLHDQQHVHGISTAMQAMSFSQPGSTTDAQQLPIASEIVHARSNPTSNKPTFWDSPYPDKATRDNNSLAENTCSMICYIWFSDSIGAETRAKALGVPVEQIMHPLDSETRKKLQFSPSDNFRTFMQGILQTTQLSRSVVVLALHYIYCYRQRSGTVASEGSETRLAIAALMMANKFVDDNTYTNRTWSDCTLIPLDQINTAEQEFLLGVNFSLHVSSATYDAWLKLLKGLAIAKEADHWSYLRRRKIGGRVARARSTSPLATRTDGLYSHSIPPTTSQGFHPTQTYPSPTSQIYVPSPSPPSTANAAGAKRSANDAFSPEYVHAVVPPSKRGAGAPAGNGARRFAPPVRLPQLVIPSGPVQQQSASAYFPSHHQQPSAAPPPSEPVPQQQRQLQRPAPTSAFTYSVPVVPVPPIVLPPVPSRPAALHAQPPAQSHGPSTYAYQAPGPSGGILGAPYELQGRLPNFSQPQDLFYYAIAATPVESAPGQEKPNRKHNKKYHHPAYETTMHAPQPAVPPPYLAAPVDESLRLPPLRLLPQHQRTSSRAGAQLSPFANAGSPGVHWTGTRHAWYPQPGELLPQPHQQHHLPPVHSLSLPEQHPQHQHPTAPQPRPERRS